MSRPSRRSNVANTWLIVTSNPLVVGLERRDAGAVDLRFFRELPHAQAKRKAPSLDHLPLSAGHRRKVRKRGLSPQKVRRGSTVANVGKPRLRRSEGLRRLRRRSAT